MSDIASILAGLLLLAGVSFTLVAALGLLRFPDLYTRMHAASKAGSVGAGMTLLALALVADETAEALRALAAVVFFLLTTPLSAHLLAKAAHAAGYPLWKGSVLDEMRGKAAARGMDAPSDASPGMPRPPSA